MDAYLAILNPAAGGGRCGQRAPGAIESLRRAGVEVDVVTTGRAGEAVELVRQAYSEGRRKFIAVGGDGTGYEVVNGLFPAATEAGADAGERPVLGFMPMGTGNSFLRDFTTEGAVHSMRALREGARRSCDVIRLTHADGVLHYINLCSIGFVADVAGTRQRRYSAWGEFGYVASVFAELAGLHAEPFPLQLDGGSADRDPVTFLSFNNSKFTGGKMMMAPGAETGDGRLDVIRAGRMGRIQLLRAFPKIFAGTHVEIDAVSAAQVASVDFDLDRKIDVMVDGESLVLKLERLEVLPGVLDVCV